MQWEKQIFERNIKTFNKVMGQGYHDDLDDGMDYNQDLMDALNGVLKT